MGTVIDCQSHGQFGSLTSSVRFKNLELIMEQFSYATRTPGTIFSRHFVLWGFVDGGSPLAPSTFMLHTYEPCNTQVIFESLSYLTQCHIESRAFWVCDLWLAEARD